MRKRKGNLSRNVKEASAFLETVQGFVTEFPSFLPLLELERFCRRIYANAVTQEQSYLKQRAKVEWLKDGDQCTPYFFRMMSVRKARSRILRIESDQGIIVDEPELVRKEIIGCYSTLLGSSTDPEVSSNLLRPYITKRLSPADASYMARQVTGDEIKRVLFGFKDIKAPGPDGYTACFFKKSWDIVGREVTLAIEKFFYSGRLVKGFNSTLIALIHKVEVPKHPKDFRPISCCNVIYKIISKIIANRLREFLGSLVDKSQTAFIPVRLISDNILLAQELLHGYNKKNLPARCAFKVDLMKAYDMVEWKFVLALLEEMNFDPKFIMWVRACMTSPAFSININGEAAGYFYGKRGLRQGDPMSPYLFVLVMEILHGILTSLINSHHSLKYHWRCHRRKTVMLSFADDLLLFCNADVDSIRTLQMGMNIFGKLSGLQANPSKSNIFLSTLARPHASEIQPLIGYNIGSLPVRYLGVPLITSKLTIADCNPLVKKLEDRLGTWSNRMLSYVGRLQLIRSILATLHIYWAGIFILPKKVIRIIESKIRKFLWKGGSEKGYAKVAWSVVCSPIVEGGLGIIPLEAQNRALITRHIWALLVDDGDSYWVEWVRSYRLSSDSFWHIKIPSLCPWSWRQMLKLRPAICSAFSYQVGNGDKFLLWKDPWHPHGILLNRYALGPMRTGLPHDVRVNGLLKMENGIGHLLHVRKLSIL
ncbi:hypothetical protein OROHE_016783 [Orobanche hederae]